MPQNLYTLHNASGSQSPLQDPLPASFRLTAPPNCDIWRKPPSTNDMNAPFFLQSFPLSTFRAARVTISAQWSTKFDQGGLLLILPGEKGQDRKERKWIKTGVEFYDGRPNLSTVATDRWSDWSLAPIPENSAGKVVVEMTRELRNGNLTSTLWIHGVNTSSGEKLPLREVAWVFEEASLKDDAECEIGVYVAKPIRDDLDPSKELEVTFEDLIVDTQ